MKTNAIIRIVFFSLTILILLGILLGVIAFDMFLFDTNTHSDRIDHVEEKIDMYNVTSDIRNIEIDWVTGSITFQKDQNARDISIRELSADNSKYHMVLKQSGQTMKIKYCDQASINFTFGTHIDISKDLVIIVPANWDCNSLEIDTAAADVVLNDLTIHEFDFDGASGICKMNNCSIGKLDIDTASGNVYFSGTLETLDCDAASADYDIEVFNIPRSIKIDGLSGDLKLTLPPDAGFTCNLDSMNGSFDTDFSYRMHSDAYICGNGDCKIKVSAMSGAVIILKGIDNASGRNSHNCTDMDCTDLSHSHSYTCPIDNYSDTTHDHNIHH